MGFIALLSLTRWGASLLPKWVAFIKGYIPNFVKEVLTMKTMTLLVKALIKFLWVIGANTAAGLLLPAQLHNFFKP